MEAGDTGVQEKQEPVRLTIHLIRQVLQQSYGQIAQLDDRPSAEDENLDVLFNLKSLPLDWMNIGAIENLDAFTHVRELYLQHNCIKKIENLDNLRELAFLALGNNHISTIEHLSQLDQLQFLDLSNNEVADFDIKQLPRSLVILRLEGNPFVNHMPKYAQLCFDRLPKLQQVDAYHRIETPEDSETHSLSDTFCPRSNYIEVPNENKLSLLPTSLQTDDEWMPHVSDIDVKVLDAQRCTRHQRRKEHLNNVHQRSQQAKMFATSFSDNSHVASRLESKRNEMLVRARAATDVAIQQSAKHFQKMEDEHRTWREQTHA